MGSLKFLDLSFSDVHLQALYTFILLWECIKIIIGAEFLKYQNVYIFFYSK